jgi:hypothetical protein
MAEGERRVELVRRSPGGERAPRIGIGLLLSLILGAGPLSDAFRGNGSFEYAIGRFLVCVAVSVGAALLLGRLLDGAPDNHSADEPTRPDS